jgi:hypothetical protein
VKILEAINNSAFGKTQPEHFIAVATAYENFAAGIRARERLDSLLEEIGTDTELTHRMWRFDIMQFPEMRKLAARDLANADIVIIATQAGALPVEARESLKAALRERQGCEGVLAWVHSGTSRPIREFEEWLRELAEECEMDFLGESPRPLPDVERWGLNE